ncbi:MAG TPA: condensation domain-containing protein, partial [Gemmatimonadaceae bacterium]
EFVAPCGDTEIKLARIWSAVLGVDLVGARDNFFDLGGHSLRATQIASRIRDEFGVELPLAELFERTTIADLARAVEARAADAGRDRPTPAISPAPRTGPLPLSYSQERVWFLQQLEPENLAYNFQTMMFFSGRLDVEALRRSLTHLVERHEILRTTFADRAGIPEQRIHSAFTVDLPVCDLRDFPLDEREAELTRRVEADLARAFDLRTPPLIRWTLFRTADDEYAMLHVEHHLIHDGWSFNVLRRELLQAYLAYSTGQEPHLPPLPIQFADFAMWQRQWMSGERLQRQLEYWQRRLAGAPSLELPTDHARPPTQTFKGSVLEMELSPELYAALRALSDRMNTTLFVTLEAAFLLLLHRYSGQDDLSIGSGVANRRWTETEGLIGMLVNNVVIRSVLEDEPTFRQFASGVRRTTLEAYEHQDAPFDHVVRVLGRGANRSRNPLFDVMFSFHDAPLDEPVVPDLSFRCAELLSNRSAKFDLNVVAVPHAEQRARIEAEQRLAGITVLWEYNTALFDRATVEQMANHYRVLLSAVVENPDHSVLELELMTAAERRALVAEHNRTRVEYPSDTTVHALFSEQARRTPDAVALVFDGRPVTYGDLDARSNSVAHRLRDAGVRRGVNVGLCCEKSVEAIVGLLAVLKAGGAFVPMEPRYPDGRLQLIAEDTNIALVLTDARSSARFAGARFPSIDLSTLGATDISRDEPLISAADASDPAYIMFTSGSTGRPKGAVIPHRAIVRLVFGPDFVAFGPERRILHMASLSFDSSTFEIWGALLHGASMIVWSGGPPMPRDLGDAVREHRVDTMWLTASMFNHVIDEAPEALSPLRWLVIGGEALSVAHVRRAQSVLANTTIVNGYGPTEST